MDARFLRNNHFLTGLKLILFLIFFCFFAELVKEFCSKLDGKGGFSIEIFYFSMLSAFAFYIFLVDLNNFYNKAQNFFFRSSVFSLIFPSIFIILGIGYLVIPKIFSFSFDKDAFVFLGGFVLTAHLIYIARQLKGHTFKFFIDYIFLFSILCILNLFFFELYLKIAFSVNIVELTLDGLKGGLELIYGLFIAPFN